MFINFMYLPSLLKLIIDFGGRFFLTQATKEYIFEAFTLKLMNEFFSLIN